MDLEPFKRIEGELSQFFLQLSDLQMQIREKLRQHSDGKTLKGNELVGWLGEIYGKYLFDGHLVDDSFEHDFETSSGLRVSVKTRKGMASGWNRTSAIPKIYGDDCPTHLLFVHLNDHYIVDNIWFFPWDTLVEENRFKVHKVRGNVRSYYMSISSSKDVEYLIYQAE